MEVEVAGYEHETQQAPTEPSDRLLQSMKQPPVIRPVLEDATPEVGTGHYMTDRVEIFAPQRSAHTPIRSHRGSSRKPESGPDHSKPLFLKDAVKRHRDWHQFPPIFPSWRADVKPVPQSGRPFFGRGAIVFEEELFHDGDWYHERRGSEG